MVPCSSLAVSIVVYIVVNVFFLTNLIQLNKLTELFSVVSHPKEIVGFLPQNKLFSYQTFVQLFGDNTIKPG